MIVNLKPFTMLFLISAFFVMPVYAQTGDGSSIYDEYGEVKKQYLDANGKIRPEIAAKISHKAPAKTGAAPESAKVIGAVNDSVVLQRVKTVSATKPSWVKEKPKAVLIDLGDGVISVEEVEGIRDPFLPVGYTAAAPVVAETKIEETSGTSAPAILSLESVSEEHWKQAEKEAGISPRKYSLARKAGRALVLINGKIVPEGGFYSKNFMGVKFTWKIGTVTATTVDFERVDIGDAASANR